MGFFFLQTASRTISCFIHFNMTRWLNVTFFLLDFDLDDFDIPLSLWEVAFIHKSLSPLQQPLTSQSLFCIPQTTDEYTRSQSCPTMAVDNLCRLWFDGNVFTNGITFTWNALFQFMRIDILIVSQGGGQCGWGSIESNSADWDPASHTWLGELKQRAEHNNHIVTSWLSLIHIWMNPWLLCIVHSTAPIHHRAVV